MDFKDNIPELQNLIKDDVPDMKVNNEELKSSGGAEVIGFDDTNFFESVSTVKAALEALSPSGIVDDNLDDDNPSNGHFFRLENKMQVCWNTVGMDEDDDRAYWDFPASFDLNPIIIGSPEYKNTKDRLYVFQIENITTSDCYGYSYRAQDRTSPNWASGGSTEINYIAIGVY